jgi:hypothetical protein
VTDVPTTPEAGDIVVITGMTKNDFELLARLFTVTTMSAKPVGIAAGTGMTILVSLQEIGFVTTPPKVTVLPFCATPKPVPVIVTGLPTGVTGPTVGEILVMLGAVCPEVRIEESVSNNMILGRAMGRAFIFW